MLHIYLIPITYLNEEEFVVSVVLTPILNIWLSSEWHIV